MALIRTNALVLRNLRMGDTSRIVTILTRDFGKFGAVAKGVREPKSRFGASLELLSVSSLILYFRPGRDLQLVSEGSLEREFRGLFSPVDRYAHACALVEFLDRTLEPEEPVAGIYDLALRALALMEESPSARLSYVLRAFQLRAAVHMGYAPRLAGCAACGGKSVGSFSPSAGILFCEKCGPIHADRIDIAPETIELLRRLVQGSLPRSPSLRATRELESIVESFLLYHLDRYRGMRSLRILTEPGVARVFPHAGGPTEPSGAGRPPEP